VPLENEFRGEYMVNRYAKAKAWDDVASKIELTCDILIYIKIYSNHYAQHAWATKAENVKPLCSVTKIYRDSATRT
jgi:hypothetical protein